MRASAFTSARFLMDAIEGVFNGYTDGDAWNGWACPYFDRETAEQILHASAANGYSWNYDAEQDAFVVKNVNDPADYEPEVFEGTDIIIDGEKKRVYPVGAYSWIWSLNES